MSLTYKQRIEELISDIDNLLSSDKIGNMEHIVEKIMLIDEFSRKLEYECPIKHDKKSEITRCLSKAYTTKKDTIKKISDIISDKCR